MMESNWRGTVLIVDDNEDNVDLAEQILEDDYNILTANSGEQCLEIAQNQAPDVILLDVQMPGIDGYETLSRLYAIESCKNIPIIFLSARYRDSDRVIHGLELGALDYITKPVDDDLLEAKIRVAMRIKHAEDMVRQQTQDLYLANQDLKGFAYSASHDLRAPLRHINGNIIAVLEDYSDLLPEDGQMMLKLIQASAREMNSLIEDLLIFSRATAAEINKTSVNLSEMVGAELSKLQKMEPDRQVVIDIQAGLENKADMSTLGIVLHNLLNNAWKYTSQEEKASIQFGMLTDSVPAVYFIKDNGVGFDMKYVDKLFQPFSRLHSKHDFEGNGIGLAIIRRIIEKHVGMTRVEAKIDEGATFFFSLET